jgi:phage FluMu protein Com
MDNNKSNLKELRCTCNRLLGKCNGQAEITCHRCGKLMKFNDGKLTKELNDSK